MAVLWLYCCDSGSSLWLRAACSLASAGWALAAAGGAARSASRNGGGRDNVPGLLMDGRRITPGGVCGTTVSVSCSEFGCLITVWPVFRIDPKCSWHSRFVMVSPLLTLRTAAAQEEVQQARVPPHSEVRETDHPIHDTISISIRCLGVRLLFITIIIVISSSTWFIIS